MEQVPTEQGQVPTEAAKVPSEYIVGMGDGSASVRKMDVDGDILLSVDLNIPDRDTTGKLLEPAYIQDFYVTPRRETGTRKYAGEGKKALCFLINKLVSDGVLNKGDAIQLDAIASERSSLPPIDISVSTDTLKKELDPYPSLKKRAVVTNQVKNTAKGATAKGHYIAVPVPNPTDDELRGVIIPLVQKLRANRKLVAYYETYGFKVVPGEDRGVNTRMRGTIKEIVNECNLARDAALAARKTGGKKRRACSGGYTRRRGPGGRARTKTLRRRRGIRR
jgi:hypothetical protein